MENRGPAAAAQNHEAIIRAARALMAEEGYDVPFSRIAQRAGVGRASLYRHFPTRTDLAWAVFADNMVILREIAPGQESMTRLWQTLVGMILESTSIITFLHAHSDRTHDLDIRSLISTHLEAEQTSGRYAGLVADDVVLAIRMLYGVLVTTEPEFRLDVAKRALHLIHPDLAAGIG